VQDAPANGCRKDKVCKQLGISVRTVERWQKAPDLIDQRKGPTTAPANKLSDEERERVVEIATCAEFQDVTPTQIVPRLADQGIYLASESTFYRILRKEKLLAHRGASKPRQNKRPEPHVAEAPNQVWSWDITYLRSLVRGIFFYLYLVTDIYSRKIVGWEVHERECNELSAQLMLQTFDDEGIDGKDLVLHSDNGGPMKGATILATLQRLGVMPSFSRPHVSDDNAFSESLFKTLKYCPFFPTKPFASIEEARAWVRRFVHWYNNVHLHSGIKFVTPASRHLGLDGSILEKRKEVYEMAKQQNPNRWTQNTRDWNPIEKVILNPLKETSQSNMMAA
jgi:transposase InsO family protein